MAGHSQFKNIMRRKGAQDAKRGKIFTKIARELIVAAKAGGDPAFNARLRAIVIKARQAGMAKDKIEAAIAKGAGGGESDHFEAVRYEGYAAHGVALIVEALTDNRNRTAADLRSIFTKHGGALGESGSVGFMFSHQGLIEYPAARILEEAMLEAAIEAGAQNCETEGGVHTITTGFADFASVRDALAAKFGDAESARTAFVPSVLAPVDAQQAPAILALIEALEENDDVQDVTANAEFDDATLARLSA